MNAKELRRRLRVLEKIIGNKPINYINKQGLFEVKLGDKYDTYIITKKEELCEMMINEMTYSLYNDNTLDYIKAQIKDILCNKISVSFLTFFSRNLPVLHSTGEDTIYNYIGQSGNYLIFKEE